MRHADDCAQQSPSRLPNRLGVLGIPFSEMPSLAAAVQLVRGKIDQPNQARAFLVSFANPMSFGLMRTSPEYRKNLGRMDLLLSDGIVGAVVARRLTGRLSARISFDNGSLAPHVWEHAAALQRRIVLVGGQAGVAQRAAVRLRQFYPRLLIADAFDGFAPIASLLERTRRLDPDLVVCGMGMPRQEEFLAALADSGWTGCGFTCGGYLDQLAQRFHYYPTLVNRLNLRWLYRLAREPRRLARRYFVDYAPFAIALLSELVFRSKNAGAPELRYDQR